MIIIIIAVVVIAFWSLFTQSIIPYTSFIKNYTALLDVIPQNLISGTVPLMLDNLHFFSSVSFSLSGLKISCSSSSTCFLLFPAVCLSFNQSDWKTFSVSSLDTIVSVSLVRLYPAFLSYRFRLLSQSILANFSTSPESKHASLYREMRVWHYAEARWFRMILIY